MFFLRWFGRDRFVVTGEPVLQVRAVPARETSIGWSSGEIAEVIVGAKIHDESKRRYKRRDASPASVDLCLMYGGSAPRYGDWSSIESQELWKLASEHEVLQKKSLLDSPWLRFD